MVMRPQPTLIDNFGCPFFGEAERIGDLWFYWDGNIKRPLRVADPQVPLPDEKEKP